VPSTETSLALETCSAIVAHDGDLKVFCPAGADIAEDDWDAVLAHFGWDRDLSLYNDYDMDFAEVDGRDVYTLHKVQP